ncbi:MAG: T9SS type A sorting domain-containing protein [Flavobacteriales bacterium]|nr:T9SS type A sorting domain-containing protein [Flavobacteriales bacterium]
MLNRTIVYTLVACCCIFSKTSFGTIVETSGVVGPWNATASWVIAIPTCSDDTIHIKAGHTITILTQQDYEACASSKTIIIDGTLSFPDNGPKLKLPGGSCLLVNSGGTIIAPGTDNSNKISVGGTWVWGSKEPDVMGPVSLCGIALPIELLSFDVSINRPLIEISWTTQTEINNELFIVEKSEDYRIWKEILTIQGAGNSNTSVKYTAIDSFPTSGTSYYRLKQTNTDGSQTYSYTVSLFYKVNNEVNINLYPNPSSGTINIEFNTIEHRTILITNARGTLINSTETDNLALVYNIDSLPNGVYYISVNTKSGFSESKMILKIQ